MWLSERKLIVDIYKKKFVPTLKISETFGKGLPFLHWILYLKVKNLFIVGSSTVVDG